MRIPKSIINYFCNIFCSNIVAVHIDGYIEALRYKDTDKYYLRLYSDRFDTYFHMTDKIFTSLEEAKRYAINYVDEIDK